MLPSTKRRALLWSHLWRAVSEEAPEVIDDLQTLQPVYAAAAGAIKQNRVYNWFSLERECHNPGCDAALLRLRDAILAWVGRWSLSGPTEPLDEAFSTLWRWQVDPKARFGLGGVWVYKPLNLEFPKLPEFDPVFGDWSEFEHRVKTLFDGWLRKTKEQAALVRDRFETERHARWMAVRIKGYSYSKIIDLEGLPLGEDTVQHAVKRLAAELGLNQL